MCQVRCRDYECGHWFHENVKPCAYFNRILDNAHKNPALLQAQKCGRHKDKISWCEPVHAVEKIDSSKMIHVEQIEGPWSVARRNIVGGHCATKELRFLPSNDPGGRVKFPPLKGYCKYCTAKAPKKKWYQFG